MPDCATVLKSRPDLLDVPGFSPNDIALAINRALPYIAADDCDSAVQRARTTIWPGLAKAQTGRGGLKHIISADNPAAYAELWCDGEGNWYASTGAKPANDDTAGNKPLNKAELEANGRHADLYEIRGVFKGDSPERAAWMLFKNVMPPTLLKGCGCAAGRQAQGQQA